MILSKRAQVSSFVVIILSLAILVAGVLLIRSISNVTAALPSPHPYFFEASVSPDRAQSGSIFTISVAVGTNRSDIYRVNAIVMKDGNDLTSIPLIDDGLHGDAKSNDGIFAAAFDSTGKSEGVYTVDVQINPIENPDRYKEAASFQIFNKNCINMKYSGNPKDKVDVVILPSGYVDMKKFISDVQRHIDFNGDHKGIFALEPFKSNLDKFNIYVVNSTDDLGCSLNCQGIPSMICCNDNKVSQEALECPSADEIIVLHDSGTFCGTASYYAKICAISRGPEVLTHEWGHTFGGLGDEYSYNTYYPSYSPPASNYPNCDSEGCAKWSNLGLSGIGCFAGCGVSNQFKPTDCDCEMCNYVGHYDSVDTLYMRDLLDKYSPVQQAGMPAPPLEKSYILNLNLNNGQLKLNDVYATSTEAPDRKIVRGDYKADIISFTGDTIYSFNFGMNNQDNPFFSPDNSSSKPSPVVYPIVDRLIVAPYYPNAQKMDIADKSNKTVLEVSLTQFSSQCGDGKCQANENAFQCPIDCQVSSKDNLCNYAPDGVCDPDCTRIDPDCKKITPLIIVNIAILVVLIGILIFSVSRRKQM